MKRALLATALIALPLTLTACGEPPHHYWELACWSELRDQIPTTEEVFISAYSSGSQPTDVVRIFGELIAENLYGAEVRSAYWCDVRIDTLEVLDSNIDKLPLIVPEQFEKPPTTTEGTR